MKRLLILLTFLIVTLTLQATTYYVKAGGNDNANGTSTGTAWGHCPGLTGWTGTVTLAAGDNILFNRGDSWYGTLTISQSGTSGSRITFGAYGSGAKPIITGFTTISGWSNNGGGIYSKAVTCTSVPTNMVTVNGVNTGKGRYPKEGNWLTNTTVGMGYITDNSLPASPNWTGANIFLKTEGYRWNHGTITSQPTHQINYTQQGGDDSWCGGNSYAGWGYFIDNSLLTLGTVNGVAPQLGEWFHDGTTFYMYFGAVDPTTKIVNVATLDNAVVCAQSYITIDNISFLGYNGDHTYYNKSAVQLGGSSYVSVTNCEIGFIGAGGTFPGDYATYDNCWIHDINGTAILGQAYNYLTLTNSIIENIGLIYSMTGGWYSRGMASNITTGTHALIQYNIFRHIGSVGAYIQGGAYNVVDKNLFDDCVSRAFDSGCIYVNGNSTGRVISNNICINTQGSMEGISGTWATSFWTTAEAIYCDYPNTGITLTGNTCVNTVHGSGIKLHNSHDMSVSNNLLYSNYMDVQYLEDQSDNPIRNLSLSNNKIIAQRAGQMLIAAYSNTDDIPSFGLTTASGNIYGRPVDDGVDQDFYTSEPTAGHNYRTYAYWLSRSGETGSTFSSVSTSSMNNIHFIYNATKSGVNYTLSAEMVDIANTAYSGTITLPSYSSLVLVGAGTVTPAGSPTFPTVTTTVITNITNTNAQSGGTIINDGGATVTYAGIIWSNVIGSTIDDLPDAPYGGISNVYTYPYEVTNPFVATTGIVLAPNTTYYLKAYATNSAGTAYGADVQFTTLTNSAIPTITTTAIFNITQTTASSGGNLTSDGGASVTSRGVCWNTSANPTIANNNTSDGTGTGSFTSSITGLTTNTTYHVRAYATNSIGTAYGNELQFTTATVTSIHVIFSGGKPVYSGTKIIVIVQ
jgi:parallel beta-helix repeat protein